jgi:hypothetical protein
MTTKKGCIIAAVSAASAVLVLVVAILLFVFGLTRGAVQSAESLLTLLGEGKIEEAYNSTSTTLQRQQPLPEFERTVKELGLTDFASASWSSREIKGDRAQLEGSIATRSGGKIPVTIELLKESGNWKVLSISAPHAGVTTEQSAKKVPGDAEAKALILGSLLAFNRAVEKADFTEFHAQISQLWQEQITAEKLKEIFADFIDKKINISGIKDVEPILTEPPQINPEGLLILEGYYPTHPSKVYFGLKYVYEHPSWKLFGIKVNVK